MRHLDLFSGIGGWSLGFDMAMGSKHEIVAFCEKDEFCQKVLRKHWQEVPIVDDVFTLKGSDYGTVDIVSASTPCQPHSCAGRRKGRSDERHLWPEVVRILREFDRLPAWFCLENVRGILSIEQGMVFEDMCIDLENLGYEVQSFIIPACGVGAPHRRDRVWICGNLAHSPQRENDEREREGVEEATSRREGIDYTPGISGADAPHSEERTERPGLCEREPGRIRRGLLGNYSSKDAANTKSTGLEGPESEGNTCAGGLPAELYSSSENRRKDGRSPQSGFCRGDDGLPFELDGIAPIATGIKNRNARLKALGNAVVPQIVEQIGRAIMEAKK